MMLTFMEIGPEPEPVSQWGLAILTMSRLLRALARSDCVYIDGTFRTAPHPYTQFVTVHGLYHGFVVPLVFCLLTGKTVYK